MVRIEKTDRVLASVEQVFAVARDKLPDLVPFLPNIERIEVKERKDEAGRVLIVNRWYAKADIPAAAKKFVSPDLLSWQDTATWDGTLLKVDYRLQSFVANELFLAQGTNTFKATADGATDLTVRCDVEIYPEKLPGVPRFLAGAVKGPVEETIKKILTPNLMSFAQGLNGYFRAQGRT